MIKTILIFIIVLSVLVLFHELGHFLAAKLSKVRVEEFGLGMFIRLFSIKKGETVYSLNAIPVGGFVKLTGEDGENKDDPKSFANKPKLKRIFILSAGVIMNFLAAVILFTFSSWLGTPKWSGEVILTNIAPGSPAAEVGLAEGDVVLKAEDQIVEESEDLVNVVDRNLGEKVSLEIKRNEEILTFEVLARENPPQGEGSMGIEMNYRPVIGSESKLSFFQGILQGVKRTFEFTKEMVVGLFLMFKSIFILREKVSGVAGPVGIGQLLGEIANYGLSPLIEFSGILSLNFAVLNILPLPALDGGRIIFIIIEFFSKKKVSAKIEGAIHTVGLLVLMLLLVFITYKDILRIVR